MSLTLKRTSAVPRIPFAAEDPFAALRQNARHLRRICVIGSTVVLVFVVGFGGWAALAPLASAALATGVVSPDGNRRTVQHLEGGIIRELKVRDGDSVKKGDTLVVLNSTRDNANLDILRIQHLSSLAALARLTAEEARAKELLFPNAVLEEAARNPAAAALVQAQNTQFQSRRDHIEGQRLVFDQRIGQSEQQIAGLRSRITSSKLQLDLIGEELAGALDLFKKGLERKPRVLQLQRAKAQLEGEVAANTTEISRFMQSIGEMKTQLSVLENEFREKTSRERAEVETELATLQERLRTSSDIVTRTRIVAPVDGTVLGLKFHTLGGVIPAGAPILEIVPESEKLTIDIQIQPADIDIVREGQPALVRFSAYHQRNMPRIDGILTYVAADSTLDDKTRRAYFLGKVDVDPGKLKRLAPQINLSAGMPADVAVTTGTRTVLQYAVDPLVAAFQRSFVED